MKVNTFQLPLLDNDGKSLASVHKMIMADLINTFGGCTTTKTQGHWADHTGKIHTDNNIEYKVAFDDSLTNQNKFKTIVETAGVLGHQLAMFYTLNTQAFIMDIDSDGSL